MGIQWKGSAFWQHFRGQNTFVLKDKRQVGQEGYNAYDITDLGRLIPFEFFNQMKVSKYLDGYFRVEIEGENLNTFDNEAEARAHFLIYLINTKKVTVLDINKPKARVVMDGKLPVPKI